MAIRYRPNPRYRIEWIALVTILHINEQGSIVEGHTIVRIANCSLLQYCDNMLLCR